MRQHAMTFLCPGGAASLGVGMPKPMLRQYLTVVLGLQVMPAAASLEASKTPMYLNKVEARSIKKCENDVVSINSSGIRSSLNKNYPTSSAKSTCLNQLLLI